MSQHVLAPLAAVGKGALKIEHFIYQVSRQADLETGCLSGSPDLNGDRKRHLLLLLVKRKVGKSGEVVVLRDETGRQQPALETEHLTCQAVETFATNRQRGANGRQPGSGSAMLRDCDPWFETVELAQKQWAQRHADRTRKP